MKKDRRKILKSKRFSCLELQIFTYMGMEQMEIESIRKGFYGIASFKTIEYIVINSPFFSKEKGIVTAKSVNHKANITYDFDPDFEGIELTISGEVRKKGKHTLKNIDLYGIHYLLPIDVSYRGVGNWKLNISKIQVIDIGDEHERVMNENPLHRSGSYSKNQKTYE